jgi:hypothetical protein
MLCGALNHSFLEWGVYVPCFENANMSTLQKPNIGGVKMTYNRRVVNRDFL